jgi:predicted transcriptional regulator
LEPERKSIDEAKAWLQAQRDRGDLNDTTGRLRITAISQLATMIADGEEKTVQWMLENIETLGRRWANKNNGNSDTTREYISRARTALTDYLRFVADPLAYKTGKSNERTPKQSASHGSKSDTADTGFARTAQEFKLPKSSYDELCKVIRAYALAKVDASINEIAELSGMGESRVSKNSGFLISVGLVTEGKAKGATSLGRRLANALEHDQPTEIAAAWREVVQQSEFLRRMVAAVRIRKGMDINDLQSHIAYSAGVPKNPDTMLGARTLANILVISGLVLEQDGKLAAVAPVPPANTQDVVRQPGIGAPQAFPAFEVSAPSVSGASVQLRVNLNITVSADELPALGKLLRKMIEDLKGDGTSSTNAPDSRTIGEAEEVDATGESDDAGSTTADAQD